jgi:hypothetical protein
MKGRVWKYGYNPAAQHESNAKNLSCSIGFNDQPPRGRLPLRKSYHVISYYSYDYSSTLNRSCNQHPALSKHMMGRGMHDDDLLHLLEPMEVNGIPEPHPPLKMEALVKEKLEHWNGEAPSLPPFAISEGAAFKCYWRGTPMCRPFLRTMRGRVYFFTTYKTRRT